MVWIVKNTNNGYRQRISKFQSTDDCILYFQLKVNKRKKEYKLKYINRQIDESMYVKVGTHRDGTANYIEDFDNRRVMPFRYLVNLYDVIRDCYSDRLENFNNNLVYIKRSEFKEMFGV